MKKGLLLLCLLAPAFPNLHAQALDTLRIPYGVPGILEVIPDARAGAMGNGGVALSPDVNATYINPAKLASAERDFGVSVSYFPWLRTIINGSWVGYASAYKKLGGNQAISASAYYFDYGDIFAGIQEASAKDLAVSASYSRQLGKNFSMGFTLKYISSDWGSTSFTTTPPKQGRAVAGDISAYYRKQIGSTEGGKDFNWSFGAIISNLGNKIDYGTGGTYFLPTKIRVGGGISYTATGRHRINVIGDLSKLMVPTPTNQNPNSEPLLKGVFGSFSDAPGGFREEIQEVMFSVGAEYWYNNIVAVRAGYYGQSEQKAGQQMFTVGAGARVFKNFNADLAYMFSAQEESPLSETFRTTVSFYLPAKKG
jgi:hypothetical protein